MAKDILAGLHPLLLIKLTEVQRRMRAAGHPIRPIIGVRTLQEQQKLYAQGRTAPGKIVTKCDGVKKPSNHQLKADGYGWAVDVVFEGPLPFGEHHPWKLLGETVKAVGGLRWGGSWGWDRPHIELDPKALPVVSL